MSGSARSVIVISAAIFLSVGIALSGENSRNEVLDRRSVEYAVATSPDDYLAAVIELVTPCEIRRGDTCFDRVRVLDMIAQAPPPGPKRTVGDSFLLFSGTAKESAVSDTEWRFLVLVVPMNSDGELALYGAKLMTTVVDEKSINSLRGAIETVVKKKGV